MAMENRMRLILEGNAAPLKQSLTTARDEVKKTQVMLDLFRASAEKPIDNQKASMAGSMGGMQSGKFTSSNAQASVTMTGSKSWAAAPEPAAPSAWARLKGAIEGAKDSLDSWTPSIKGTTKDFMAAASEIRSYESKLKAFTGSASAAKEELAKLKEISKKTGFKLEDLVSADVVFKELQVDAGRLLPIAQTLAKVTGTDLTAASGSLARAVEGIPSGLTRMQRSMGITKRELIGFGAATDGYGEIAVDTVDRQKQLISAFEKMNQVKFPTVLLDAGQKLAASTNKYKEQVLELKAALGDQLIPVQKAYYDTLNVMMEGINALPNSFKTAAAAALGLAAAVVSVGTGIALISASGVPAAIGALTTWIATTATAAAASSGLAAGLTAVAAGAEIVVPSLGALAAGGVAAAGSMAAASGAAIIAAAPFIGMALVVTAVGVAIGTMIQEHYAAIDAEKKLAEAQTKVNKQVNDGKDLFSKSAEELKQMGVGAAELVPGLMAAREALELFNEEVRNKPNVTGREKEERDQRLKALKEDLDKRKKLTEDRSKNSEIGGGDPVIKAAQAATKANIDFQENKRKHVYQTKIEELKALKEVGDAQKKAMKDLEDRLIRSKANGDSKEIQDELRKRYDEISKDFKENSINQVEIYNESRQEMLQKDREWMEQRKALGNLGEKEEAEILARLSLKYKDQHQSSFELAQQAMVKKVEAAKKAKEAELSVIEAEKSAIDTKLEYIDREIAAGNNLAANEAKKNQLVKESFAIEEKLMRAKANQEEANLKGPKNAELRMQVEKKLSIDLAALRTKEKIALDKNQDEFRARRAEQLKLNQELLQSNQAVIEAELNDLKRKQEKAVNSDDYTAPIKKKMEALNKSALEQIELERKIALKSPNLNPETISAINKKFDDQMTKAKIDNRIKLEDHEKESSGMAAKRAQDHAEIEKKIIEDKKAAFQEEIDSGRFVGDIMRKKKELAEQSLAATIQEIKARATAESTSDPAKKAIIWKEAQLQINAALRDTKKEIAEAAQSYKKVNAELDKEIAKLEKIKGKQESINGQIAELEEKKSDNDTENPFTYEDQQKLDKLKEKKTKIDIEARRQGDTVDDQKKREDQKNQAATPDMEKVQATRDKLRSMGKSDEEIDKIIKANYGSGAAMASSSTVGGTAAPDDKRAKRKAYLEKYYSPEQVASILKREFPGSDDKAAPGAPGSTSPSSLSNPSTSSPSASPGLPGAVSGGPGGATESTLVQILSVLVQATGKGAKSPSPSSAIDKKSFSPSPMDPTDLNNIKPASFWGKT